MNYKDYKFIIVGAGFYGSVIAERIANDLKEKVLIIDKREHVGGNCYSLDHKETGIHYHKYGTHIFHTPNKGVWNYIKRFFEFNGYFHQVLTTHQGKVYQMPINLETINSFYDLNLKPYEVDEFLQKEISKENIKNPRNLEEKAISLIGRPLYETFIKGYTKKQWQKDPKQLPAEIIARLPFRKSYDESYYPDRWQGIPIKGYTDIFNKMLSNKKIQLKLDTDYFKIKDGIPESAIIIYSGAIDRFFNYKYGKLEWRTLEFKEEVIEVEDYQGASVMNYSDEDVPFMRIHEPRHLHKERDYTKKQTLIIKEYPKKDDGTNPYYPINDETNRKLLKKYKLAADELNNVIIGGRLGDYKYYDMHHVIEAALETYENRIKNRV